LIDPILNAFSLRQENTERLEAVRNQIWSEHLGVATTATTKVLDYEIGDFTLANAFQQVESETGRQKLSKTGKIVESLMGLIFFLQPTEVPLYPRQELQHAKDAHQTQPF